MERTSLDRGSGGGCTPLYGETSHPRLAALQAELGRVSGGAPPLLLAARGVYLGLAHAKDSVRTPEHTGTRRMEYHHLFYAFAAAPPFGVLAVGAPFTLPQPGAPTVQFAAGLALEGEGEDNATLLVSYGVLDCGMRLTRFSLRTVLQELGLT